jgi:FkbM family methyltransferase
MLAERLRQLLSWHGGTRAPFSDMLHKLSRRYVMAWSNAEVDIDLNGERWLVEQVARSAHQPGDVYVDVGANKGEWSSVVLENVADARLIAFEPVPPVCEGLRQNLSGKKIEIHCCALSSEAGRVTVNFIPSNPYLSSLETIGQDLNVEGQSVEVDRMTGDGFCRENKVEHIRLLKVDTEGHDLKVLDGFRSMLTEDRIDIIQFEYNYMSIFSRTFLRDFFHLLDGNYRIGRLLRKKIDFFDYSMNVDNFIQANFVAVNRKFLAASRADFLHSHG